MIWSLNFDGVTSLISDIVSTCRLAPTMFHIFQYCKEWSYMDHCKIIVWEKCDVMTLSCSRFICTNFTGGLVACTDNFPFHHKLCSPQLDCSVLVVRSSLLGLGQILFFFLVLQNVTNIFVFVGSIVSSDITISNMVNCLSELGKK